MTTIPEVIPYATMGNWLYISPNTVRGYSAEKGGKKFTANNGVPKVSVPGLFEFIIKKLEKDIRRNDTPANQIKYRNVKAKYDEFMALLGKEDFEKEPAEKKETSIPSETSLLIEQRTIYVHVEKAAELLSITPIAVYNLAKRKDEPIKIVRRNNEDFTTLDDLARELSAKINNLSKIVLDTTKELEESQKNYRGLGRIFYEEREKRRI